MISKAKKSPGFTAIQFMTIDFGPGLHGRGRSSGRQTETESPPYGRKVHLMDADDMEVDG